MRHYIAIPAMHMLLEIRAHLVQLQTAIEQRARLAINAIRITLRTGSD